MTLDQLQVFLAVAETGSFSAAGRRLHRVQSAISYSIARLEDELNLTLFDRAGRRPRLTAEGGALLDQVRGVVDQVAALSCHAQALSGGLEPEVSLVVDAVVPVTLLVTLGKAFQQHFPQVQLRLRTDVLGAVPELVRRGDCQLGVSGPVGVGGAELVSVHLGGLEMVAVAAPEHPLARGTMPIPTARARQAVQVVISQQSHSDGVDHGVLSALTWRVVDAPTKRALICAGLGWGSLPLQLVADDLAQGRLVQLHLQAWGSSLGEAPLYVVHRRDHPPGPAASWLMAWLQAEAAAVLASGAPPSA